jgi:transcriptional regulator with XRE-family HTH domain
MSPPELAEPNANEEPDQKYRNPNWLRDRREEGLSLKEIAERADVHKSTISYWMRTHGLERLDGDPDAPHRDREWLQEQVDRGLSQREIAEKAGTSRSTAAKWLHKLGVYRRRS